MSYRDDIDFGKELYEKVKGSVLVKQDRWGAGIEHHPMSLKIMGFIGEHDFYDCGDGFCWKYGGDGDNGENLMYEMDAFFEALEQHSKALKMKHSVGEAKKDQLMMDIDQHYDDIVRIATDGGEGMRDESITKKCLYLVAGLINRQRYIRKIIDEELGQDETQNGNHTTQGSE